jgi:hypothetical protein
LVFTGQVVVDGEAMRTSTLGEQDLLFDVGVKGELEGDGP